MSNKIFLATAILAILAAGCHNSKKPLVQEARYSRYLKATGDKLFKTNEQLGFWANRLQQNPNDMAARSKMAGLYAQRFGLTGHIHDMELSDSLYTIVNQVQKNFGSSVYRALATNAITRHRFGLAAQYLDSAFRLGDDKKLTLLQMSDAALELGYTAQAKKHLEQFPNKKSFEYFSRKAKIADHEGRLNEAIQLMEQALQQVQQANNEELTCWAKTNLADYYSHNNELKKALQLYYEVLDADPEYYHALKGIAWIAFSHDRNTKAAEKIVQYLARVHPVPDYLLLLAEIAAYQNDTVNRTRYMGSFIHQAGMSQYGGMYNKYLFELYANELNDTAKALQLAEQELANRSTPEVWSWLSWAQFKSGNTEQAWHIQKYYVEGKCFEPDVLYRMAQICRQKGEIKKARIFMKEVRSALFELGPSFEKELANNQL